MPDLNLSPKEQHLETRKYFVRSKALLQRLLNKPRGMLR
jgi:hypothetical protein